MDNKNYYGPGRNILGVAKNGHRPNEKTTRLLLDFIAESTQTRNRIHDLKQVVGCDEKNIHFDTNKLNIEANIL